MKPGKLIQTSCANGTVARHATSTSSTTAAAALVCPVVAGAAESNAGEFRRTLSTFGTVARLKAGNKGQFIQSTPWLYAAWHAILPLTIIVYALFPPDD